LQLGFARISTILGVHNDTATAPRIVVADNGIEYIAKSDFWYPGDPPSYIVLQELIYARLACRLKVPTPPFELLKYGDKVCFASKKLPISYQQFHHSLLGKIANPDVIYALAALDTLIVNSDRHDSNLIVSRKRKQHFLYAIDHSHCPLEPSQQNHSHRQVKTYSASVCVKPFLRAALTDREMLADAIRKVQDVDKEELTHLLSVGGLIQTSNRHLQEMLDLIVFRRNHLNQLFNIVSSDFPAIQGDLL
jgi:hypothetical protein